MNPNALIIFTRNPELGKCKTRLAKTIGNEAALDVYKFLLSHTAKIVSRVTADKYVYYSENIISIDLWDESLFNKKLQKGNDLGERMQSAFEELFGLGYKKVMIIGSDLLDLKANLIQMAFKNLETNDVVIGPAQDGGYYLLGMKKLRQGIFQNKNWSTESVLQETLKDLKNQKVALMEELNDIDTFEDIKNYPQLEQFYKIHD